MYWIVPLLLPYLITSSDGFHVLQIIFEQAHGSPLYASEVAMMLQRNDALEATHTGRVMDLKRKKQDLTQLLPTSLIEYIDTQVESLSSLHQFILKVSGHLGPLLVELLS